MHPISIRWMALLVLLTGPWLELPGSSRARASEPVASSDLYWELRTETLAQELSRTLSEPGRGEAKIAEQIEEIARKILDEHTAKLKLDDQARRLLWNRFRQALNPRSLARLIQSKRDSFVRLLRTQGIPALATLVVEVLVNVGGTWLVHVLGAPQLVPVILGTPTFLIAHPANLALYRRWESALYAKKFGGKESYRSYLELRKSARRELLLETENQVLAGLAEGTPEAVSVRLQSSGPLRRIGQFFGLFREDLTPDALLGFLREQQLKDSFIEGFSKLKTLDEPTRVYLLLNHLQLTLDDESWMRLKARFHASFGEARASAASPALLAWLRDAAAISEPHELSQLLRKAPSELSPAAKWTFWFELILPRAVENVALGMEARELRDLRQASQETWILSQKHLVDPAAKKYTDGELRAEFLSRLRTTGQVQGFCAELFREMAI